MYYFQALVETPSEILKFLILPLFNNNNMTTSDFLDLLSHSSSIEIKDTVPLLFRNYSPLDANLHQYKLSSPEIVSQV